MVLPGCESNGSGRGEGASKTLPKLPTYEYRGEPGPEDLFQHGVASGDPLPDAVILWTRVTLTALGAKAPAIVEVFWEIATDEAFTHRVGAGTVSTDADRDFTVKVDASGLSPATRYHYRFHCLGRTSLAGTTLTAPDGAVDHLRFGVCSCAKYSIGYYAGYRLMAERADLAAVLHLGDYIYESDGAKGLRPNDPPHRCVTLADYRLRYARQRTDADLQLLHRRHPMIAVWDDHEVANDGYKGGAQSHGKGDGDWAVRKAAGTRAWREWLPVRESSENPLKIWRRFRYGELLDLMMLDTRFWGRDPQINFGKAHEAAIRAESRTMLGMDQEAWLAEAVTGSTARWVVIGQQVMMAPLVFNGIAINHDQWDDYPASRNRLFAAMDQRKTRDVVVLSGDIHSSWANELVADPEGYEPGSGKARAVEFVCPGITSSFPDIGSLMKLAFPYNPQVRWVDMKYRGLFLLDVRPERVQADWYFIQDVTKVGTGVEFGAGWSVERGSTALQQRDQPAS